MRPNASFYLGRQTFKWKYFSLTHFFSKFTELKENTFNKRSKIEMEISFVSSTENHLFMTRDLIHTIKTKPPNNTGTEGAIFDIRYSLPAVLIKNASVGAVL